MSGSDGETPSIGGQSNSKVRAHVTEQISQDILPGPRPTALGAPRRSWIGGLVLVAALVLVCAGAFYGWLNYDRLIGSAFAHADAPASPSENADEVASLKQLQTSQQQLQDTLQSVGQDITAERTDLKNLSDQLSALVGKVDALTTASISPVSQPVSPPQAVPPVMSAVVSPAKRAKHISKKLASQIAKPAGPTSVGGAPLQGAPSAVATTAATSDE